jgi:hypothetical protein
MVLLTTILAPPPDSAERVPLVVDLGALLQTNSESILLLLRIKPWILLKLPFWWLKNRAYLKHRIADAASPHWREFDPTCDVPGTPPGSPDSARNSLLGRYAQIPRAMRCHAKRRSAAAIHDGKTRSRLPIIAPSLPGGV